MLEYNHTMRDCLFCDITTDSVKLVWENEIAAAFNDIHPKAPKHLLVVPKRHIAMLDQLTDVKLAGQLLLAVQEVARVNGLAGRYRVQINNGRAAGQAIDHLHFHVLGDVSHDLSTAAVA